MAKPYPLTREEFKNIFSKVPKLAVEAVIENEHGILLTLRTLPSWHGQWHIPCGTVAYQETLHHAVKRVPEDEVGIVVTIEKFLGYIEYPSEQRERGFGSTVGLAFYVTRYQIT